MALPFQITLATGSILVLITNDVQGFSSTKGYSFGSVEQIYSGCIQTVVGDIVMFKYNTDILIHTGVSYRVISESDIILYESIPFLG